MPFSSHTPFAALESFLHGSVEPQMAVVLLDNTAPFLLVSGWLGSSFVRPGGREQLDAVGHHLHNSDQSEAVCSRIGARRFVPVSSITARAFRKSYKHLLCKFLELTNRINPILSVV